ncbi:hypothetical protein [Nostoc sp. C117]|uniref:hypothetical protein n=1 Tax=Nostoc sp. C117 TaxID=3349875 RepID=UPI00370DC20D
MAFERVDKSHSSRSQTPQSTSQFSSRPFAPPSKRTTPTLTTENQIIQGKKLVNKAHTNLLEIPGLCLPPKKGEPPRVQAKLTIGQPGDKYEQQADAMAHQVVEKIHQPQSEIRSESLPQDKDQLQAQPDTNTIQPQVSRLTAKSTKIIQRMTGGEAVKRFVMGGLGYAFFLGCVISNMIRGETMIIPAGIGGGILHVLMGMLTEWVEKERAIIAARNNPNLVPVEEVPIPNKQQRKQEKRRKRIEDANKEVIPSVQQLLLPPEPNSQELASEPSSSQFVKVEPVGNDFKLSLTSKARQDIEESTPRPQGQEIAEATPRKEKKKRRQDNIEIAENTDSDILDTDSSIKFIWHGEEHTREQLEIKIQEVMPANTQKSAIGRCITGIENGYGKATTGHTNVKHFSVGKAGSNNGCTLFFEVNTETNVNNVVGVGQHESTAGTATTYKIFMGKERFGNILRL